jgi:hypothetical protein
VPKLVYGARCFDLAIGARCGHAIYAGSLIMMKLLTNMTQIDVSDVSPRDECMSYGGVVDRETACATDVSLWSDAEIIAALESAASARQKGRTRGRHAA